MVELAQSDIAGTLPSLLDDLRKQPVVICRDGEPVGAVVSIEAFDRLKQWDLDRMREISAEAGTRIAEHAAELGITPEELVEQLLSDVD